MGIILSGVERVKPLYEEALKIMSKVSTFKLQRDLESFVFSCFEALKPLSYELRDVCSLGYGKWLCVGEWIRIRDGSHVMGSLINQPDRLFELVREHGEHIGNFVRNVVRREFMELVRLTRRLKPYDNINVKVNIPETVVCEIYIGQDYIDIKPMKVRAVELETNYPQGIRLICDDGSKYREITDSSKIVLFEDIIGYVVELYRKADREVSIIKQHNYEILEKMSDIVMPFKVARELKG